MKFKIAVSLVLVSLMIIVSAVPYFTAGVEDKTVDKKKASWTFIVYLDADNNLEGAGVEDLNEMETVGSTDDVNIVVLMDRAIGQDSSNGDWTGGKIFYVTKDDDTQTINSQEIMDVGEPDMGDPETLINFTDWAIDNYPADNYILDLWDHGGAFIGACWDDGDPNDDSDDDWLDLDNITYALSSIKDHLGRNIDIVAYDACLMGAISVMYSEYGYADISIGSGPTEPGDGWPYERILKALTDTPSMTPTDLAKEIVTDYVESYNDFASDPQDSPKVTMAAWDMAKMQPVFSAVNALGMALSMESGLPPSGMAGRIYAARSATHSYDIAAVSGIDLAADYPMYDLYDLATQILNDVTITDQTIRDRAKEVQSTIENACIQSSAGLIAGLSTIYGLSVYFPTGQRGPLPDFPIGPASPYSTRYDSLQWSKDQFWDDFLKSYWDSHTSADDTPPAIYCSDLLGDQYEPMEKGKIHGSAYDLQGPVKVMVSVDGGDWKEITVESGTGGQESLWSYDLGGLSGTHEIAFKSVDSAGMESPTISGQITISKKAPAHEGSTGFTSITAIIILVVIILAVLGYLYYKKRRLSEDE